MQIFHSIQCSDLHRSFFLSSDSVFHKYSLSTWVYSLIYCVNLKFFCLLLLYCGMLARSQICSCCLANSYGVTIGVCQTEQADLGPGWWYAVCHYIGWSHIIPVYHRLGIVKEMECNTFQIPEKLCIIKFVSFKFVIHCLELWVTITSMVSKCFSPSVSNTSSLPCSLYLPLFPDWSQGSVSS